MKKEYSKAHAWKILEAGLTDQYGEWPYGEPPPSEQNRFTSSLVFVNEAGVWPNMQESGMGWKPCWELVNDPEAPDCSATPGLPFPFSPNELAAWMLKGCGAYVAACFGSWEDGPDFSTMNDPDSNKAREAVRAAYAACRSAIAEVGPEPEPIGEGAHEVYENARQAALEKFGLLGSQGEALDPGEHASRLREASQEVEHLKQAILEATARDTQQSNTWVNRMVRHLLVSQSESSANKLLADAQFRDGFASVAYGAALGAEVWAKLPMVPWNKGSMLVCGINPNLCPDPEKDAPLGTDLVAWRMTSNIFESVASDNRNRTLRDWAEVALNHGLEVDSRVTVAMEAVPKSDGGGLGVKAKVSEAPTKRVLAARAQEATVLAKLVEFGFDPVALPPFQPGRSSEAKQKVKEALPYTPAVFDKAWSRLSRERKIMHRTKL